MYSFTPESLTGGSEAFCKDRLLSRDWLMVPAAAAWALGRQLTPCCVMLKACHIRGKSPGLGGHSSRS